VAYMGQVFVVVLIANSGNGIAPSLVVGVSL
jgi:hypothetical protein